MVRTRASRRALLWALFFIQVLGQVLGAQVAWSDVPECYDQKKEIPIDNGQALQWKKTTKNQFRARAHVAGTVSKVYGIVGGDHYHFQVKLGDSQDDVIEIVYQRSFGDMTNLVVGMRAEACGDYITANQKAGGYNPSPDGAIIHWVHENDRGGPHEDGFVILNTTLYGIGKPREVK